MIVGKPAMEFLGSVSLTAVLPKTVDDSSDLDTHFVPRNLVLKGVEDAPSLAESDVSDDSSVESAVSPAVARDRLQWEFKGLTLWLEYEELNGDLSRAIDDAVHFYGTERIPIPHSTAIYGMTHLSTEEARKKLQAVLEAIPTWPLLDPARGITQGIAEDGKPGQVCNIAWAELSFQTNNSHEDALDKLYQLFEMPTSRQGPWTPHISFAYDNPQDSVLNITETFDYVVRHPTLLNGRKISALSLWNTNGRMGEFECIDRVYFQ